MTQEAADQATKPKKAWYKKWWIWTIAAVVVIGAFGAAGGSQEEEQPVPAAAEVEKPEPVEEPAEAEEEPPAAPAVSDIEVIDMSTDGNRFISASFPVADAFTNSGIVRNLKDGCVAAIQAAKAQVTNWWEYDTIQCMGLAAWTEAVVSPGSANFSGAQLAEISDADMTSNPDAFWDRAERSNIAPELQ